MTMQVIPDLLPFTRRTTNSSSRTRQNWETPRTWGWLKHQGRLHEKAQRSSYALTAPPPGQHGTTQRGLPWASSSPSGKREPTGTTSTPSTVGCFAGSPTLTLLHGDFREICWVQPLGIWMWRGDGPATSTWIVADRVHNCSAQVIIPIRVCSPSEPPPMLRDRTVASSPNRPY